MASTFIHLPVAIVNVDNFPISVEIANDIGNPLPVSAINLDIRDLVFAFDKADVSGSVIALDAPTLLALENITVQNGAGLSAVNIQDGGNSITVDGPLTNAELRAVPVPISGTVAATQGTSPWAISALSLPLPTGAATSALQTQPGVDIGDVTVNNAAGINAVNIQDGGNSITVDGPLTDTQLRAVPVPIIISSANVSPRVTYSAATAQFVAAALATDIFTITGSATRTIRITKMSFGASSTNPITRTFQFLIRSTANSGGVSVVVPRVRHDSTNVAPTAEVLNYTANPATLGTLVGAVRTVKTVVPQNVPLGGATNGPLIEIIFGGFEGQAIVLRGVNQVFSLNMQGVTLAGNQIAAYVEWTEE